MHECICPMVILIPWLFIYHGYLISHDYLYPRLKSWAGIIVLNHINQKNIRIQYPTPAHDFNHGYKYDTHMDILERIMGASIKKAHG